VCMYADIQPHTHTHRQKHSYTYMLHKYRSLPQSDESNTSNLRGGIKGRWGPESLHWKGDTTLLRHGFRRTSKCYSSLWRYATYTSRLEYSKKTVKKDYVSHSQSQHLPSFAMMG
jgi:hypothetical protein